MSSDFELDSDGREVVKFDDVICIHSTAKAILVKMSEDEPAVWIPQSQVSTDSEVYKQGDDGVFIVYKWIAQQKGWVEK